jgi:hypothetical protein
MAEVYEEDYKEEQPKQPEPQPVQQPIKKDSGLKKATYTVLIIFIGMLLLWFIMDYFISELPTSEYVTTEMVDGMKALIFLLTVVVGVITGILILALIATRKSKPKPKVYKSENA